MRARVPALTALLAFSGCSLFFGDDRAEVDDAASASTSTTTGALSTTASSSGATSSSGDTAVTTSSSSGGGGGLGGSGAGGGGGGGGGGGEPLGCGTTSLLSDDFEDQLRSARLWSATQDGGSSMYTATGITLTPTDGSPATVEFTANHFYVLREDAVAARVIETLVEKPGNVSALRVFSLEGEVAIEVEDGVVSAVTGPAGQRVVVDSRPYDAASDHYWRIRHEGGRIHFELGESDDAYESIADIPEDDLGDLDHVRATLQASSALAEGGGEGQMRIEDVHGEHDDARACAASSFTDTFGASQISVEWLVYEDRCYFAQVAGELEVSIPSGDPVYCAYATARLYDLREDFFSIQVSQPAPVEISIGTGLDFFDLHLRGASLAIVAGELHLFEIGDEAVPLAQLPLVAGDAPWIRFRVEGSSTHFESSPDGVAWETRMTRPTWFDPEEVQLRIFVASNVVLDSDLAVAFDNHNAPP